MIGSIVGGSIRFRFLILGLAAAMLIFGLVQLPRVPVDALPEFGPPYVEVQTEALGLSAEEVEQLLTVPLEADLLHGVAWLDEIHSESIAGLSSIVLVFEPGTDVIRARQMVSERLTQAHALPNVSKPPVMLQPLSSSGRVMMVGLSSPTVSLIDMSVLARWVMRPSLLGVPGVASVAIWGQRDRQLQVLVDPQRLRSQKVTLQEVISSVGNSLWASPLTFLEAATPGTGGFIDTPNQPGDIRRAATSLLSGIEVGFLFEEQKVFEVVVWGAPEVRQSLSTIGDLQIDTPSGVPVRLAEVAAVRVAPVPGSIRREGVMRIVDVGASVEGGNLDAVLRDVDAALAGISFPLEYHAEVRSAAAEQRGDQLRLLMAMIVAAIGVFLVLQAAFESWRLAAMTFLSLPAAIVGGVLAAYVVGGGAISLGAMAGLLAVLLIAIRNGLVLIVRYRALEEADPDAAPLDLMRRATRERFGPILVTAAATALALAPFIVLGNLPGLEVLRPMAAVIVAGLVSATLTSLFILPAVTLRSGPSLEAEPIAQHAEPPAVSPA